MSDAAGTGPPESNEEVQPPDTWEGQTRLRSDVVRDIVAGTLLSRPTTLPFGGANPSVSEGHVRCNGGLDGVPQSSPKSNEPPQDLVPILS
jgi:hypothetical protein